MIKVRLLQPVVVKEGELTLARDIVMPVPPTWSMLVRTGDITALPTYVTTVEYDHHRGELWARGQIWNATHLTARECMQVNGSGWTIDVGETDVEVMEALGDSYHVV